MSATTGINLDSLSDEVLSLVISKLPLDSLAQLSCASKRMHNLCHYPPFWTSVRISDTSRKVTPYSIAVLCGKGSSIRHLCIDLHHTILPDSILHYLASSCPSLVSLSLYMNDDTPLQPGHINLFPIKALDEFLTNSRFIRSLYFSDSTIIDDRHLVKVLPHLQMTREIDLAGCNSLTDTTLIKLVQQCPSLQILDISRLPINGRCIERIFQYCSGLHVLRCNGCREFHPDTFLTIHHDYLKNLTELSLINTPVKLENTLQGCKGLKRLYASISIYDSILIPFLKEAQNLEALYMGVGSRVTVASAIAAVQYCGSRLTSLTFHPFEEFGVPSDPLCRLIIHKCPNMKNLSLAHCREISTYWVIQLLDQLDLESLCLFGWEKANSSTLRMLLDHFRGLSFFAISGCKKLTPKGFAAFVLGTHNLKVIKCENTGANGENGGISREAMDLILQGNPRIKEDPLGVLHIK